LVKLISQIFFSVFFYYAAVLRVHFNYGSARLTVCLTRKQQGVGKTNISVNVFQGTCIWCTNFSLKRLNIKVTGRQKHPENNAYLATMFASQSRHAHGTPCLARLCKSGLSETVKVSKCC